MGAVAGLVGNLTPREVLQLATSRMRDVELSALTREDLADNNPNPALYMKSAPARMADCDAFISHSWRDDPDAKWDALQRWRRRFISKHGREPRVWIDKVCIDASDIERDLRCLPVFLSGCQKTVVLCGTTYLSRLWCMIELFTFVQMGRSLKNLEFEIVLRKDNQYQDMREVERTIDEFNAEKCSCFNFRDKERILCIILAAFGSIDAFNQVARGILRDTNLQEVVVQEVVATRGILRVLSLTEVDDLSTSIGCSSVDADQIV